MGMTEAPARLETVIVTGLSGAGRSTAAKCFEDLGYFVVDNLPAELIATLVDLGSRSQGAVTRLAVVMDVRSRAFSSDLRGVIRDLDRARACARACCSSRRPTTCWCAASRTSAAPTRCRATGGCVDGIAAERELLAPLRDEADLVHRHVRPVGARTAARDRVRLRRRRRARRRAEPARDRRVVRLQVRPAGRRRPRRRRAVPAQPVLDPRAARAHRPGRRGPGLRARQEDATASSTATPRSCRSSAPATSARASAT